MRGPIISNGIATLHGGASIRRSNVPNVCLDPLL